MIRIKCDYSRVNDFLGGPGSLVQWAKSMTTLGDIFFRSRQDDDSHSGLPGVLAYTFRFNCLGYQLGS
jgi:hypothetical protein